MAIDPDAVVHVFVDEEKGVCNYTLGNAVSDRMRSVVTQCLQHFMPEAHAVYKAIKNPPSGVTMETRRKAYEFAFDAFKHFVLKNYVRIEEKS